MLPAGLPMADLPDGDGGALAGLPLDANPVAKLRTDRAAPPDARVRCSPSG